MNTAPRLVTAALLVAAVTGVTTGLVAPASAADRPTTQTVAATTNSADQAGRNVADPSRFEFRIRNTSTYTHSASLYESFRLLGNTPPDAFERVVAKRGTTKRLRALKEPRNGYTDLRISGTGSIWVKIDHNFSEDDAQDYMATTYYTGGLRADGTPVLRVEKVNNKGKPVGHYVDLTVGKSTTIEQDMTWYHPDLTKPMKVTITCESVLQTEDGGPLITWFDVNITPPGQS